MHKIAIMVIIFNITIWRSLNDQICNVSPLGLGGYRVSTSGFELFIHATKSCLNAYFIYFIFYCFMSLPFSPPVLGAAVVCFCVSYEGPMVPRSCGQLR